MMLVALVLSGAGPAAAASHKVYGKYKIGYDKSWTFKSPGLGRCVVFTATGTYTYTIILSIFPRGGWEYSWINQVLHSPTLHAAIKRYSHGKCGRAEKLVTMTLDQEWTGYSCSFNPSISVSVPFGLSFGGWPGCGSNRNQGGRTSGPYPKPEKAYTQYNSGEPLTFGNYGQIDNLLKQYPCYGVYVATTAYTNSASDGYSSGSAQVCLSKR